MDINDLRGIGTVFAIVAFISICIWAYSGKRRKDFDTAAQMPLNDDDLDPSAHKTVKETHS